MDKYDPYTEIRSSMSKSSSEELEDLKNAREIAREEFEIANQEFDINPSKKTAQRLARARKAKRDAHQKVMNHPITEKKNAKEFQEMIFDHLRYIRLENKLNR